jgi:hypothetical protein
MNTWSRARANREERKNIQKQRRIERKERFATSNKVVTPYKLRSTMGRKGDKSQRLLTVVLNKMLSHLKRRRLLPLGYSL